VMKKIASAKKLHKPVDGHAPGLRGDDAKKYIEAGISTDHECFTKEEALDKLKYKMKIIIREGSAAKNFEALIGLLNDYPDEIMFCSDDKHPDSLAEGHINVLCKRSIAKGIDIFKVLQAACINPVYHYKLDVGLLKEKDAADFILVNDLKDFKVQKTYINGELVAENGNTFIQSIPIHTINNFSVDPITINDLTVPIENFPFADDKIPVIEALDGQLITNKIFEIPLINGDELISDVENDILKIVVVNRYNKAPVAKAFIKNFGLKQGAIASSVAHDSHNIVAIGCNDASLLTAINLLIKEKGGVSCVDDNGNEKTVALPVAGLMSNNDGYKVAAAYTAIDKMAKELGSILAAPFMTLSFMALLVIPHIKLSDKGLFNGDSFSFF
jgi:adenine deaminase